MKRMLGPLRLLFALVLLSPLTPSVTTAQDAARPAKSARPHRDGAHKARKKKARKTGSNNERTAPVETGGAAPDSPPDKREKRGKSRGRSETHAGEVVAKSESGSAESSASASAAQQAAAGVNAQIVKEGDTSVKVMEFSGLGIEGRLKSPQLVYFTQRVRAEFERPRLPHRSFMPELEASAQREPVR